VPYWHLTAGTGARGRGGGGGTSGKCAARALEEREMAWARDADGMRRSRMDGCLSPSTIDDERRRW